MNDLHQKYHKCFHFFLEIHLNLYKFYLMEIALFFLLVFYAHKLGALHPKPVDHLEYQINNTRKHKYCIVIRNTWTSKVEYCNIIIYVFVYGNKWKELYLRAGIDK